MTSSTDGPEADPDGVAAQPPHVGLAMAAGRTRRALAAVVEVLDEGEVVPRRSARSRLGLELVGLAELEAACADGVPPHHVWSLGQASVPVLSALVATATPDGVEVPDSLTAELTGSIAELRSQLTRVGEARA